MFRHRTPLISLSREASRGFTIIEVVAVLSLTGILAAVALPKFFDLQGEAARKACLTNQAMLERAALEQWMAARLNGEDGKTAASREKLRALIASMNKNGNLCPEGGTIDIAVLSEGDTSNPEGGLGSSVAFHASCSKGHTANANEDGTVVVAADNASAFWQWILSEDVYGFGQGKYGIGDGKKYEISTIDQFFSKYSEGIVDSEADFEGANFDDTTSNYYYVDKDGNKVPSLTAAINSALEKSGLDTSNIIWRLERVSTDQIFRTDSNGEFIKDKDGHRVIDRYSTELRLTVAKKPDGTESGPAKEAYEYTARIDYGSINWEMVDGYYTKTKLDDSDNKIQNITMSNSPKPASDATYEVAYDKNGKEYLALATKK